MRAALLFAVPAAAAGTKVGDPGLGLYCGEGLDEANQGVTINMTLKASGTLDFGFGQISKISGSHYSFACSDVPYHYNGQSHFLDQFSTATPGCIGAGLRDSSLNMLDVEWKGLFGLRMDNSVYGAINMLPESSGLCKVPPPPKLQAAPYTPESGLYCGSNGVGVKTNVTLRDDDTLDYGFTGPWGITFSCSGVPFRYGAGKQIGAWNKDSAGCMGDSIKRLGGVADNIAISWEGKEGMYVNDKTKFGTLNMIREAGTVCTLP